MSMYIVQGEGEQLKQLEILIFQRLYNVVAKYWKGWQIFSY